MVLRTPATVTPTALDATLTLEVAGQRQTYRLLHPTRIGRSPACQIRLGGAPIHAEHATLLVRGNAWMIEVAPLAPPVSVNDVAVRSAMLRAGDIVSIAGIRMVFGTGRGEARSTSKESIIPARMPKDPIHPQRAWIEDLAGRQTAIDIARTELEAERDEWLIRLAAEKKLIEQRQKASLQQTTASEERLRQSRSAALVEHRQSRLELDQQRNEIESVRQSLAQERADLLRQQADHSRAWQEMQSEHQRQLEQARGTRSASVRLLQQLERDRTEIAKRLQQVGAAESRLAQTQSRIERQLEIGSHELAGLQRRIDNERILLAGLQRRRLESDPKKSIVGQLEQGTVLPRDVADLEDLTTQIESALRHVEASTQEIAIADKRQKEQEIRLQHLARHLALEEKRWAERRLSVDDEKQAEIEKRERQLDSRSAELERRLDELLAEKTNWASTRSAWEESQASERTLLDRERDRLRHQRWRLAVAHRQRLAKIRQSRQHLHKDQERVLIRIAQMTRQEASLEILKQEIHQLRLAQLEHEANRQRSIDPLGSSAMEAQDRAAQHRQHCEQRWARFEARLQRSIEWIETEILAGRSDARRVHRAVESGDKWRVESASLAVSQLDQQRAWDVERKKYQEELARLREELESMAAHLISPRISAA
ncbi:FHA domain-containing protein [bacterium]|nr:FHA domain-containing protein [bacterium]